MRASSTFCSLFSVVTLWISHGANGFISNPLSDSPKDWWRGRTGGGAGLVSNPILQVETLQFRVSMAYPKSHVDK
jgi:hypothetical protein